MLHLHYEEGTRWAILYYPSGYSTIPINTPDMVLFCYD